MLGRERAYLVRYTNGAIHPTCTARIWKTSKVISHVPHMCQGKYSMSSLCLHARQGFHRFKSMILAYFMQRNDRSILQMCNHCSQLTIQMLVHVTMDPKPEQLFGAECWHILVRMESHCVCFAWWLTSSCIFCNLSIFNGGPLSSSWKATARYCKCIS